MRGAGWAPCSPQLLGPPERMLGPPRWQRAKRASSEPSEAGMHLKLEIGHYLAVRVIYFLLFLQTWDPEISMLGRDPSQSLNYSLQLRSVQF